MQLDGTFPAVHPGPDLLSAFRTFSVERVWGGVRGITRGLWTSDRKGKQNACPPPKKKSSRSE